MPWLPFSANEISDGFSRDILTRWVANREINILGKNIYFMKCSSSTVIEQPLVHSLKGMHKIEQQDNCSNVSPSCPTPGVFPSPRILHRIEDIPIILLRRWKKRIWCISLPKHIFFAREGLIWNKRSRFSERIATPDKTVKALFQIDDTFTLRASPQLPLVVCVTINDGFEGEVKKEEGVH